MPLEPFQVPAISEFDSRSPDLLAVERLVGLSTAVVERELILATLGAMHGNRTHTATVLGISLRTLRNKLAQYAAEAANPNPADVDGPGSPRVARDSAPRVTPAEQLKLPNAGTVQGQGEPER